MAPPAPFRRRAGYTLVELMTVVTLIGVLSAAAVPSLDGALDELRVQSLVRRLTGDLHLARLLAVRDARPVDLILQSGTDGCVTRYRISRRADPRAPLLRVMEAEAPGVCLLHNGSARLTFDPRGMARSGGRRFTARSGHAADTVVVSFAGRIRTGRRRRRPALPATFSGSATISLGRAESKRRKSS